MLFELLECIRRRVSSWKWQDMSPVVSSNCVTFRDFNADLYKDTQKSESLFVSAEEHFLIFFLSNSPTYLRSERVIDYVLCNGIDTTIQTYHSNTTSDHLVIVSVIQIKSLDTVIGRNVHWKVVSLS